MPKTPFNCHRKRHQPRGDLILRPVILTLSVMKGKNLMSSLPLRLPRFARNDRVKKVAMTREKGRNYIQGHTAFRIWRIRILRLFRT